MDHIFGILAPNFGKRQPAIDAPHKTSFFGGPPDGSVDVTLSRAEREAAYLTGKYPEPDPLESSAARPYAFVVKYLF